MRPCLKKYIVEQLRKLLGRASGFHIHTHVQFHIHTPMKGNKGGSHVLIATEPANASLSTTTGYFPKLSLKILEKSGIVVQPLFKHSLKRQRQVDLGV